MRTIGAISALALALLSFSAILPARLVAQSAALLQVPASPKLAEGGPGDEAAPLANAFASRPETKPAPLSASAAPLPDAPSPEVLAELAIFSATPCRAAGLQRSGSPDPDNGGEDREPCLDAPSPYSRFVSSGIVVPLTPMQKGYLAVRNEIDPGNLITIFGTAAFTVGTNSHTAYGPGWQGFGRNAGYSLLQDSTGEFFGTFLIPSLTREDPHYHRMPHAGIPRRVLHAISRTVMAESDDGSLIPNYSTLFTYPICAEISNLYVPGVNGNGPATMERIMTGYATDPIDNLITEFLPDVARHIHVRVIFVQRVLNQVDSDPYALP